MVDFDIWIFIYADVEDVNTLQWSYRAELSRFGTEIHWKIEEI